MAIALSLLILRAHKDGRRNKTIKRRAGANPRPQAVEAVTSRDRSRHRTAQDAVANFLKGPDAYSAKKRKGKAHKLSERDRRAVFRHATLHKKTTSQIAPLLLQRVSARTVRRELQRNDNAKYVKRSAKPKLKPHHVAWARTQIRERTVWEKIIFSDGKKFNLDGPDGLQFCWHDLRKEKEIFFSRQNGGGSVMIWGGFSAVGTTKMAILSGRQDSFGYQQTLTTHLFPWPTSG